MSRKARKQKKTLKPNGFKVFLSLAASRFAVLSVERVALLDRAAIGCGIKVLLSPIGLCG
jgi:hypothetical protein